MIDLATWFVSILICAIVFYYMGRSVGIRKERSRCSHLCHTAIMQRWSPTLRWAYNAIDSGAEKLRPMEEFVDPIVQKMDDRDVERILNEEFERFLNRGN